MEENKNCNNCAFLINDDDNEGFYCSLSGEKITSKDHETVVCDEWEYVEDYPGEDDIFTEYELEDDED